MAAVKPESFWMVRRYDNSNNPDDFSTEYERDRARILHSPGFRRLQSKTQVLSISETDYHRTRLTHTMEVAQIGRGLTHHLRSEKDYDCYTDVLPSKDLIEAIAFAHDLGHPPFGHNGEVALNYMMRNHGGFEGNAQSLRMVSKLEQHVDYKGHDLTRRTLLGILKYPRPYSQVRCITTFPDAESFTHVNAQTWKPPKCFYDSENETVNWILQELSLDDRVKFTSEWEVPPSEARTVNGRSRPQHGKTMHKSLDGSILELADDIAYGTHDLEDGVAISFITEEHWCSAWDMVDREWADRKNLPKQDEMTRLLYPKEGESRGPKRRHAISSLIGAFLYSVRLEPSGIFESPVLDLRACLEPEAQAFLEKLKDLTIKKVIQSAEVQTLEFRGRMLVTQIFDALMSDPHALLKQTQKQQYEEATTDDERMRALCDYVAGMTDPYASRFFERLYIPRAGSTFDKL